MVAIATARVMRDGREADRCGPGLVSAAREMDDQDEAADGGSNDDGGDRHVDEATAVDTAAEHVEQDADRHRDGRSRDEGDEDEPDPPDDAGETVATRLVACLGPRRRDPADQRCRRRDRRRRG